MSSRFQVYTYKVSSVLAEDVSHQMKMPDDHEQPRNVLKVEGTSKGVPLNVPSTSIETPMLSALLVFS